ncbi:MAG TPA: hypothetical protein DCZ72_00235 [Armatimonadetes bacterium]|nr:hypothetical protein [Armatimonadota bacterium]
MMLLLPALSLLAAPLVEVVDDWSIRVTTDGGRYTLAVQPPTTVTVEAERYDQLPVYNPQAGGWARGPGLRNLRAQECTAPTYLYPETVRVTAGPEADARELVRGTDYEIDDLWGTFGRLEGGWPADQPVYVSYRSGKGRIDSVVIDAAGLPAIRTGYPHQAVPQQAELLPGDVHVANLWIPGRLERLVPASVLPLLETAYPEVAAPAVTVAEQLVPQALAKLRSGETLRLMAWGDSVTDAGYLPDPETQRWQVQFVSALKERFPQANIELINRYWGGYNTDAFMAAPPGSEHNYVERILGGQPDLVVSEFVNDAWMTPEVVEERYTKILNDFTAQNAEWIILTPHYVRGDWMGLDRESDIDDDPRPYVKGVREFGARHSVAIADTSLRWGRLWRQGIPYSTLLSNAINHPDPRGMKLFVDALMELFPAK